MVVRPDNLDTNHEFKFRFVLDARSSDDSSVRQLFNVFPKVKYHSIGYFDLEDMDHVTYGDVFRF